ncbi:hypothetical protein HZR21_11200 [Lactococcus laudensis]|jgi:hypothetical protein|uniref:Uncharacterized protein n=1 Tax=Pseudolactococcus laudensis TaxID=1494461 RepID=A0A7V8N2S4_9LACT|nr:MULTISPECIES: hypothetical protein [Lactococcus]MBR2708666.1 hypothetical protein [Bacilli bacterium]SOB48592.1 conserved hypothetical protein [Lactococcus piscium]ATC62439.1 hypothetical protein CMV25_11020 [Lactococcus raffinolactis]MBA0017635.1 hypothetical protein [Lactococcus laudensis]MBW9282459.1 hypothetical protein [Lactococcus laudensis]
MANKFEQFSSTNNEYEQENTFPNTVKENVKEETNIDMNWEKKIKTSFSIKKSNLEKLDSLVKQTNARSRSSILDKIIEDTYELFDK